MQRRPALRAVLASALALAAAVVVSGGGASARTRAADEHIRLDWPSRGIPVGISHPVHVQLPLTIYGHGDPDHVSVQTQLKGKGTCPLDIAGTSSHVSGDRWSIALTIDPADLKDSCSSFRTSFNIQIHDADTGYVLDVDDGGGYLTLMVRYRDFDVSPEPVTKGSDVTARVIVERASWDDHAYEPYLKPQYLQFVTGDDSWGHSVADATPHTDGTVTVRHAQTRSGCWRIHEPGTTYTEPKHSESDCVRVSG